jgi:hypothetical protein
MSNDPSGSPGAYYRGYFREQFQSQFLGKRSYGGLVCIFTMGGNAGGQQSNRDMQ